MTIEAAAKVIDVAPVTIPAHGEVDLKTPYVRQLLELYDVPAGEIAEFMLSPGTRTSSAGGTTTATSCPTGSALFPQEVLGCFEGLECAEPGLVVPHRWKPDGEPLPGATDVAVSLYAGVARKL